LHLKAWLQRKGMTQKAFAKLIRTDQPHVSELVNRKLRPSLGTIDRIAVATKGEVVFDDWMKPFKKVKNDQQD
jgi:transcriptional regulator with XRE-family HTH domain